jgi:hypothetical protein
MIWIIASIPFWIIWIFFFPIATIAVFTQRRPDETPASIGTQFLSSLLIAGVSFYIAAKIAS